MDIAKRYGQYACTRTYVGVATISELCLKKTKFPRDRLTFFGYTVLLYLLYLELSMQHIIHCTAQESFLPI